METKGFIGSTKTLTIISQNIMSDQNVLDFDTTNK